MASLFSSRRKKSFFNKNKIYFYNSYHKKIKEVISLQKWKWWHIAGIILVIVLYVFNYRAFFIKSFRDNSPILSREEITALNDKVEKTFETAKIKIANDTYTPLDWQRDTYFWQVKILRSMNCYNQEKFFILAGQAQVYAVDNYYRPKRQAGRNGLFFQQTFQQAQNQVLKENNEKVDWAGGFFKCHLFMWSFLPYAFLIILIKRSTKYKFLSIKSASDVGHVLLATAFSVFGALVYDPASFLENSFQIQLEKCKKLFGGHGFGLFKAYLLAIVLVIICLLRHSHAQAKTIQPIAVMQITATEEKAELPTFSKVVAVIISYFNNLLQKIKRKIVFIIPKNIFLFVKQPLEFIWGLWARPPNVITRWCVKANGFRAPAASVICAFSSRQQITSLQGEHHENQNVFSFPSGVSCFGFCPR